MRLLLDTHIAVWAFVDDIRLSPAARRLIEAPDNVAFVSVGSVWEVAIKHRLNRGAAGDMPLSAADMIVCCEAAGFDLLPISGAHAVAVETIPSHHSDPFDRLLLAQALCEPLRLITHDGALARYGDVVMLV